MKCQFKAQQLCVTNESLLLRVLFWLHRHRVRVGSYPSSMVAAKHRSCWRARVRGLLFFRVGFYIRVGSYCRDRYGVRVLRFGLGWDCF